MLQHAKVTFHGPRFDVRSFDMPGIDGKPHRKDVVVHPGAVVILPLLDADRVVLIRNERVAVDDTLWELPAGTLEPAEGPQRCAERELIEETGYRGASVTPLAEFYTSPGICTEKMYAFVATGLEHVGQNLDETERITPEIVPMSQVLAMIRDGRIRDGKTIATVLFHQAFGKR